MGGAQEPPGGTQVPTAVASLWDNAPSQEAGLGMQGMGGATGLGDDWGRWNSGAGTLLSPEMLHVPASPDLSAQERAHGQVFQKSLGGPQAVQHNLRSEALDPAAQVACPVTPPRQAAAMTHQTPLTPNSQIAKLLNINQQTPQQHGTPLQAPGSGGQGAIKLPTPVAPMRPNSNSLLNKLLSGGINGGAPLRCVLGAQK